MTRFTTFVAFVLAFMTVFSASAATAATIEYQHVDGTPTLDLFVAGKVHGKLGWSAFALITKSWSEAFAGPTFAPASWIQVSVNAGLETAGSRFYESLFASRGRVSVLGIYEHGHSGPWHKAIAEVAVGKGLAIGAHDQAFLGRGPRASFSKGKVTVWAAALLKDGDINPILALRVSD